MKRIVLSYGLISGAMAAGLMVVSGLLMRRSADFTGLEYVGFTGIILTMLLVFFGVRAYRDGEAGGYISFGRAFQVGLGITLISCLCYVLAWLVVYYTMVPDFMERYSAFSLEKLRAGGAGEAEMQKAVEQMEDYKALYTNPFSIAAVTFLEPFPIGLLVTVLSSILLKRRAPEPALR